jgi:hypothetical protein
VYKRLTSFEAAIDKEPLPEIDQDFLSNEPWLKRLITTHKRFS